mgnify:CR=1 FL=1
MKANLISFSRLIIFLQIVLILPSSRAVADVSKEIVTEYENPYVNRAMFLKVPIRGERQTIFMKGAARSRTIPRLVSRSPSWSGNRFG